jgi:uncharacterized protein YndB with AHSA1/START domain
VIHKTALLRCAPARAFALFTEHAGEWWPPQRRHTGDPGSAIVVDPAGRFYERAADGREVELGAVRVFEPGVRLVLDWYPGTGPALPTHVEVRFEPEGGATRVTVDHRPGPFSVDAYRARAAAYEGSWDLVLTALARAAGER